MKTTYLRRTWILPLFLITISLHAQNVAINTTGTAANASAILDLSNTSNMAFLPPRVALTDVTLLAPVPVPGPAGLIVYSTTAPAGGGGIGMYYWDGSKWNYINNGLSLTGAGTLNYLARWTPNGTTLGIGVTQDNGLRVGIQTGVYGFGAGSMLVVTGNATDATAISGITNINTGFGVTGVNTSGSGSTSGVYGGSSAPGGYGVWGNNTANSGNPIGVLGSANNAAGIGVAGSNTAINGTGVRGSTSGLVTGSIAVDALSTASGPGNQYSFYGVTNGNTISGTGYGIYAASTGTNVNNFGGYFSETGGSSANYGVYGISSGVGLSSYGVYGAATGASPFNYGGYFSAANGTNNFGIQVVPNALIGNPTGTQGSLILANTTANSTTIQSSNLATAPYTIVLPIAGAAGANYLLGSTAPGGTLQWINPGAAGGYILNQNTAAQTANYWITGPAAIGTNYVTNQQFLVQQTVATNVAIEGDNTAAFGASTGIGVEGTTTQGSGYGVYGNNTSPSPNAIGVYGTANAGSTDIGVEGNNTVSGGIGVEGTTNQTNSIGVVGVNSALGGTAISGGNSAASGAGTGTGVLGTTAQSGGVGVWGRNFSTTAGGVGVFGNATGAAGTGVEGVTTIANGIGVEGVSTITTGTGTAVLGTTTNTTAGSSAIRGSELTTTGIPAGVIGNIGNLINPTSAVGVYGALNTTTTGVGVGGAVFGTGTAGTAVFGYNASTGAGTQYGIQGGAGGAGATTNIGGYFSATGATTNIGIQATPDAIIGTPASIQGSLILANTTANSTTVESSNSATAAYTMTLPVAGAAGANYVLGSTGANATLQWIDPSAAGGYILNQSTAAQTANYWITGPAAIGTNYVTNQQFLVQTNTVGNIGIEGNNTAASGTGAGVEGIAASATGYGVQGVDNVAGGIGVLGINSVNTSSGVGVSGIIGPLSNPGSGTGVYGAAKGAGLGLCGTEGWASGTNNGSVGVFAINTSTGSGNQYGIEGVAQGAGPAVNVGGLFSAFSGTLNHAIQMTGGDIAFNANAGTAGQALTSGGPNALPGWTTLPAGSGTLDYVPKWTPNGTTLGNSQIFDNGTNVGIGTNTPSAVTKLTVTGDGTGFAQIGGGTGCGGNYTGISLNGIAFSACGNYNFLSSPSDENLEINRPTGNNIYFREDNGTQMTIAAGGNVGINCTSPIYSLDVNGSIRASGSVLYGGVACTSIGNIYAKPDYVFQPDYKKTYSPLEIEKFIIANGHLPWVLSAADESKENNGAVDMTRMSFQTLEAAENIQMQVIEQQKKLDEQNKTIAQQQATTTAQQASINEMKNEIDLLKKQIAGLAANSNNAPQK